MCKFYTTKPIRNIRNDHVIALVIISRKQDYRKEYPEFHSDGKVSIHYEATYVN